MTHSQIPASSLPTLYQSLYRLRRFEETVLDNFPRGLFYGTTHTYLGQEANAVGVLTPLQPGDIVFSNHRCHGHFLAYGGDMRALFAELMGKATGVCGGRGGSQHLHWQNFYSNGILGGTVPIATGMALAEKIEGTGAVAVVFIGDGALGEGTVYESLNMASLWGAPILYVVENNRIAQTTPADLALAGTIPARFTAFGIPTCELDTSDVTEILPAASNLLHEIRTTQTPRALILHTCRFGPHSKGDDTRSEDEVARMRETRDPVKLMQARLDVVGRLEIENEINVQVQAAFEQAVDDQAPIFSAQPPASNIHHAITQFSNSPIPVLESLNASLHRTFAADPRVHHIGEDILDPYGGAFKVTRGLSTQFPDRVHTSPISEAGIAGVATGMALRGLLPVVEIMFGDFTTLIADQLINHAAKFRGMYNEQVRVPLVVRTPMGGRRGYGATHSQTLEKHFLGAPGLRVLAPTALGDPGALLEHAILHDPDPVLFVENKLLYLAKLHAPETLPDFALTPLPPLPRGEGEYPSYLVELRDAPPASLTMAAYGYMAELAREAMLKLAYEEEIFTELVVPTQLSPFEMEPILDSVRRTGRLLAVEEGTFTLGWGAEIIARAAEAMGSGLKVACRVAAREEPIPAARSLEEATLPGVGEIVEAVKKMV